MAMKVFFFSFWWVILIAPKSVLVSVRGLVSPAHPPSKMGKCERKCECDHPPFLNRGASNSVSMISFWFYSFYDGSMHLGVMDHYNQPSIILYWPDLWLVWLIKTHVLAKYISNKQATLSQLVHHIPSPNFIEWRALKPIAWPGAHTDPALATICDNWGRPLKKVATLTGWTPWSRWSWISLDGAIANTNCILWASWLFPGSHGERLKSWTWWQLWSIC